MYLNSVFCSVFVKSSSSFWFVLVCSALTLCFCVSVLCFLLAHHYSFYNLLKLNEDKTEILLVGPLAKRTLLCNKLGHLAAKIKPDVTCLGIIIHSELNFNPHLKKVTMEAYCIHLNNGFSE